jgi:perosamine synthetase
LIGYSRQQISETDLEAVMKILKSDWLTQGPTISLFEDEICKITGAKYAVAVSNATAGLHISLLACGIGSGKHISVPTNTFVSTANVGVMVGAEIDFIDTDPHSGNLDLDYFEQHLVSKTDVVIPVHFGGLPVDMDRLDSIIDTNQTIIIEDASHALGAKYPDGSMVGCCKHSKCTVFSFHPVKIITTGEGGIVTTNDEETYMKLLRLRSHGINKMDDQFLNEEMAYDQDRINPWYYEMRQLGFNYRLTDIQAALGISQLSRLQQNFKKRQNIAFWYDNFFSDVPGISPLQTKRRLENAHHLYPVMINFDEVGLSRRELIENLKNKGIGTQVHYIPVHLQPFYQKRECLHSKLTLNGAMEYYNATLSIPCYPDLILDQQQEVARELAKFAV